jgi:hypothetical protein
MISTVAATIVSAMSATIVSTMATAMSGTMATLCFTVKGVYEKNGQCDNNNQAGDFLHISPLPKKDENTLCHLNLLL